MKTYERHPLSALFSAYDLRGEALDDLAQSIRDSGQLMPITLLAGLVLDGWNRYQACRIACVEPVTMDFDGSDPWEFVKGINMLRRHMSPAERVAILLLKSKMGGVPNGTVPSINQVRKEIEVGRGTAERAVKVMKADDPELNRALADKRVSLSRAAKIADMPKQERAEAIAKPPEPVKSEPEHEAAADALADANDRAADLAIELEAYMLAAGENGEAAKEIIRLTHLVETISSQRDQYMTKCNELIKQVKSLQTKLDRMTKAGDKSEPFK